jgi:RNA polymerase sigma factor (sigma-70 family)
MDELSGLSDAELVEAACAGDRDAFGVLITRHVATSIAAARTMLGSDDAGHDIVQEAMLHAYLSLGSLRDPGRFGSWVYGITLNLCRSHLRTRHYSTVSLEALIGGMHFDAVRFATPSVDPADVVEERDLYGRVLGVIEELSPKNREAVLLHYYDGLSLPEVAALLGTSVTAIKGRLHKSRQSLRGLLAQELRGRYLDDSRERETTMVKVRVADVVVNSKDGSHVIVLVDEASRRMLPLWVGPFEATAIAFKAGGASTPRPLTYEFITKLMEASGTVIEEVRIEALRESVFYGVVVLNVSGAKHEIDARPSDAIALALHAGSPIHASDAVMQEAGVAISSEYQVGASNKGVEAILEKMKDMMKVPPQRDEAEREANQQRLLAYVFGGGLEY